jgi:small subunit ribosomal protein S20
MAKRIKSGLKRVEIAERNRQRNVAVKSELKTRIKQAKTAIEGNGESKEATVTAISSIDKAARKGVIHANKAARLKSRLMKKLNAAAAGGAVQA